MLPTARLSLPHRPGCLPPAHADAPHPHSPRIGHVFWDLDNVRAPSLAHLPFWAFRFRSALADAAAPAGAAAPAAALTASLTAFCNERTVAALGTTADPALSLAELSDALGLAGGVLVPTTPRKQSADLAMRTEMYHFAQRHGGQGALAVVTGDNGFAPILRYCAAQGCFVLAISSPRARRRLGWDGSRSPRRQPLAQAAHAALTWDPHAAPADEVGSEEARLLGTDWQQGGEEPWQRYRRGLAQGRQGGFVGPPWQNPGLSWAGDARRLEGCV